MTHPNGPLHNHDPNHGANPGVAGHDMHPPISGAPVSGQPYHNQYGQYGTWEDNNSPVSAMPVSASPDIAPVSGIPVSGASARGANNPHTHAHEAAAATPAQPVAAQERSRVSRWGERSARVGTYALGALALYMGVEGIGDSMSGNYASGTAWLIGAAAATTGALRSRSWARRARENWQAQQGDQPTPPAEAQDPAPQGAPVEAQPAPAGAAAPAARAEGQAGEPLEDLAVRARRADIQGILQDPNQPRELKLQLLQIMDQHPNDLDAQDAAFARLQQEQAAPAAAPNQQPPQPAMQDLLERRAAALGIPLPSAREARIMLGREADLRRRIDQLPANMRARATGELEQVLLLSRAIVDAEATGAPQAQPGQRPEQQQQPQPGAPAELRHQPPQPVEQMPQLPMPDLNSPEGVAAFVQQYPQYIAYSRQAGLSPEQTNRYEGELSRAYAAARRMMGGPAAQPGSRSHVAPVARDVARRPEIIGQPDANPAAPGRRRSDGTEIIPVNQGAEEIYQAEVAAREAARQQAAARANAQPAPVAAPQPRQHEQRAPSPADQRVRTLPAAPPAPRQPGQGRRPRAGIVDRTINAGRNAYRERMDAIARGQQQRRGNQPNQPQPHVRTLEDLNNL